MYVIVTRSGSCSKGIVDNLFRIQICGVNCQESTTRACAIVWLLLLFRMNL